MIALVQVSQGGVMAYELHIERLPLNDEGEPPPIPLGDWKAALAATKGVRLCSPGVHSITNPTTGQVISVPGGDGDAELYFSDERAWYPAFYWSEGAARFNARFEPGDSSDPAWVAAVALASRLGAVIRGDEGELYDLRTGKIIDG
jgi:hypothetical protein